MILYKVTSSENHFYFGRTTDAKDRQENHTSTLLRTRKACDVSKMLPLRNRPEITWTFETLATYDNAEDARWAERDVIAANIHNPLCLNTRTPNPENRVATPKKNPTFRLLIACSKQQELKVFTSVNQAAVTLGAPENNVYMHLTGRLKSVAKHKLCEMHPAFLDQNLEMFI